jgi:hypothetical protein
MPRIDSWALTSALQNAQVDRATWFSGNGGQAWADFERSGDDAMLARAITQLRRAVLLTPDGDVMLPDRLANLAIAAWAGYERSSRLDVLDEAILCFREAAVLTSAADEQRFPRLGMLGRALAERGVSCRDPDVLRDAHAVCRQALGAMAPVHPHRASHLEGMAFVLQELLVLGDSSLTREMVKVSRELVALSVPGQAEYLGRLAGLAAALWNDHAVSPGTDSLEEAAAAYREVVALTPATHPDRGYFLAGLGIALWSQVRQSYGPASSASAWERRKLAQVVEERWGAGSIPAWWRISQMVEAAVVMPRTRSSPWMRR